MRHLTVTVAFLVLLTGCASYNVDKSQVDFSNTLYAKDVVACGGGPILNTTFKMIAIGIGGSAIGAIEGATTGAITGSSAEGALLGVIAGGVIGLGAGAYDAVEEQDFSISDPIRNCLEEKGYTLVHHE